jgi:hypothetical protein
VADILVKVKVKVSMYLPKHHAMNTYVGMEVQFHAFLTSALNGVELSVSQPGSFTSEKKAPYPIG